MKFASIIAFILMVHISLSLVNAINVTNGNFLTSNINPESSWLNRLSGAQLTNNTYTEIGITETANWGFWEYLNLLKALGYFTLALVGGIIAVPTTFTAFGMPMLWASIISIPIYFIYFLAIAQLISNRGMRGMK